MTNSVEGESGFVNLCKSVGYPNCDFKFNNENVKEAVEHFVSKHGCILTTSETFQMELKSFKESAKAGGSGFHFWTPIIADLKERKFYLLTIGILNRVDASFTWLSIYLPYPTNQHRESSPVETEYTIKTDGDMKCTGWTRRAISLKEADEMLPNQIAFVNYSLPLVQGCSNKGSLLIDCNIKRHGVAVSSEKEGTSFVCTRNSFSLVDNIQPETPIRFYRLGGSAAAMSFRSQLIHDCRSNRGDLFSSLRKLFEGGTAVGLTEEDVEWLKTELIFLTAHYGSVESLKYLIGKEVIFNIVDGTGRAPLHYTMFDSDKKIGLEKAKLLIDPGNADVHVLDDKKWSALHYAARFGSNESVEYFLRKGFDVSAKDIDGCTPLHFASSNSSEAEGLKIVETLIANGADPI